MNWNLENLTYDQLDIIRDRFILADKVTANEDLTGLGFNETVKKTIIDQVKNVNGKILVINDLGFHITKGLLEKGAEKVYLLMTQFITVNKPKLKKNGEYSYRKNGEISTTKEVALDDKKLYNLYKHLPIIRDNDKVVLITAEEFYSMGTEENKFDLIIANPPYHHGLHATILQQLTSCKGDILYLTPASLAFGETASCKAAREKFCILSGQIISRDDASKSFNAQFPSDLLVSRLINSSDKAECIKSWENFNANLLTPLKRSIINKCKEYPEHLSADMILYKQEGIGKNKEKEICYKKDASIFLYNVSAIFHLNNFVPNILDDFTVNESCPRLILKYSDRLKATVSSELFKALCYMLSNNKRDCYWNTVYAKIPLVTSAADLRLTDEEISYLNNQDRKFNVI